MKIQKIVNDRLNPFHLLVEQYNISSPNLVKFSLNKWGQTRNILNFSDVEFEPLYTESRAITRKKYDDLQKFVSYVPEQFQWFYSNLKFETDVPNSDTQAKKKLS